MDLIDPLLFLYFQRINNVRGHSNAFFNSYALGKILFIVAFVGIVLVIALVIALVGLVD